MIDATFKTPPTALATRTRILWMSQIPASPSTSHVIDGSRCGDSEFDLALVDSCPPLRPVHVSIHSVLSGPYEKNSTASQVVARPAEAGDLSLTRRMANRSAHAIMATPIADPTTLQLT